MSLTYYVGKFRKHTTDPIDVDLPSSVILLTRSEWTIFYLQRSCLSWWRDFVDDTLWADHPSAADCTSYDLTRCRHERERWLSHRRSDRLPITVTQTVLVYSPLSCRGAVATAATRYCLNFNFLHHVLCSLKGDLVRTQYYLYKKPTQR